MGINPPIKNVLVNPLRKISEEVAEIFHKFLKDITKVGYLDHVWKVGYFAQGINWLGKKAMIFITYNSDSFSLKYFSAYTLGEKEDIMVLGKRPWISLWSLPEEQFKAHAKFFSVNYDQKPPYSELFYGRK